MASSRLLPTRSLSARPRASGEVFRLRDQAGFRAVGARGERFHLAVRSPRHDDDDFEPVAAVGRLVGEHDTRLWRVLRHYVEKARTAADHSGVTRVAFDETAARRGHDYVSLFVDLDGPRVLFVADGKDATTVETFAADLADHDGAAENVTEVCIDMSAAFIKGTAAHLPNANITFDKFHAVKIINDAVDLVRRVEQKDRPELKKTRYIWLKNKGNLSAAQFDTLGGLTDLNLKTARASQIRLTFQDLYAQPSREAAEAFLKKWYFWATHCRLEPVIEAAGTIKRHWNGILRWFDSKIAKGILEASTASFKPPRPKPEATDRPATSRRLSTSLPASSNSSYPLETAKSRARSTELNVGGEFKWRHFAGEVILLCVR